MYTILGEIKQNQDGLVEFSKTGSIAVSSEQYGHSKIALGFKAIQKRLVVIPKYLSASNYLYASIDANYELVIGGVIKGQEKIYTIIQLNNETDEAISILDIVSHGSRFTFTFNGKTVYKLDSSLFVTGEVRLYGEEGEIVYSCIIEEPQSTSWKTNVEDGDVEIKYIQQGDLRLIKMIGSEENPASISQIMQLEAGSYVLSYLGEGSGQALFSDKEAGVVHAVDIESDELKRCWHTFELPRSIDGGLTFETNGSLTLGELQLEAGTSLNTYLPNASTSESAEREHSVLSYPIKDTFPSSFGSFYVKVSAPEGFSETALQNDSQIIAKTDDNQIQLAYKNKQFRFTAGKKELVMTNQMMGNGEIEILATWNEEVITLNIRNEADKDYKKVTASNASVMKATQKALIFAEENSMKTPITLEEWALFNYPMTDEDDVRENLPRAIMHSLFDGGISGTNVTWSEIPVAPVDHSPILVQKTNGESLQKVSFFDFETGKYQTMNKQPFVYDGRSDFVEVAYDNLDEQYRDIAIVTEAGEKIGEPYTIEGKRIYFKLDNYAKRTLKNAVLYAVYQVNDTYTIDYNIKALDGYRIDFAKHDGGKRVVYQEGNRFGEMKHLATMIEMNPILNQNHEGFLYVTNTVNKTETFRMTATPDRLHADGSSFSTLIVEPLDYQGNFLSHSNIEIVAERGFVARHIAKDAVEAQKRSGQYLYQYFAPYIQATTDGEVIEDYIWITDKDNGIGICYKMLLSPVKAPSAHQLTNDQKTMLKTKSSLIDYILMYEETEPYENEELISILDLNKDGRISMDDVAMMESNQLNEELPVVLNQIEKWEETKNDITTA